ncbi:hypothetical protein SAMN06265222_103198 [Neorhodopirellula lusitana]|uniref:Secreted protein n=1 Tax=Neorhodopirellula lusitana TaxID=445327 RepID=A0ABY1PW97_9BACT|nr:hypothetical protein SAMN06265222_103198 [Neorhodopirellula lusitana]
MKIVPHDCSHPNLASNVVICGAIRRRLRLGVISSKFCVTTVSAPSPAKRAPKSPVPSRLNTPFRAIPWLLGAITALIVAPLAAQTPFPFSETSPAQQAFQEAVQPTAQLGPTQLGPTQPGLPHESFPAPATNPASNGFPAAASPPLASHPTLSLAEQQERAIRLINRVTEQMALGPAFDCKVRQRVWVGGREVIGVGTYEQAGEGSGRFNLQVAMHDGDGKHTLQQISDGRLAWTREQIGDEIQLQRVDVGRLDQWIQGSSLANGDLTQRPTNQANQLPPSLRVGGFAEMLENLVMDHDLKVVAGQLEERDVWIVRGSLKLEVRRRWLEQFGTDEWPELCPSQVVVAIAKSDSPDTQFGQGIPVRFEFWTDPAVPTPEPPKSKTPEIASQTNGTPAQLASHSLTPPTSNGLASVHDQFGSNAVATPANANAPAQSVNPGQSVNLEQSVNEVGSPDNQTDSQSAAMLPGTQHSRLVSLIELYSIRRIMPPPIARFRFDNQDMEVNFTNDTDRYLERYGIQITERQSRMLRR